MFGVPAETEFDVRFRLLGLPVRINPFFWVIAAILGQDTLKVGGSVFAIWVGCVFFSILVHEFGHALVARLFGAEPDVLLYSMGGLCVYTNSRETLKQRLMVIAMGPGAGFILCAVTIVLTSLIFGISLRDVWHFQLLNGRTDPPRLALYAILFLIEINLYWGLFNLLPIMPLDGGQIAGILLTFHSPTHGRRRGYILSILTGGILAIYFFRTEQYYRALLVGLLALNSYQVLQTLHYQTKYGDSFDEDADWWKR